MRDQWKVRSEIVTLEVLEKKVLWLAQKWNLFITYSESPIWLVGHKRPACSLAGLCSNITGVAQGKSQSSLRRVNVDDPFRAAMRSKLNSPHHYRLIRDSPFSWSRLNQCMTLPQYFQQAPNLCFETYCDWKDSYYCPSVNNLAILPSICLWTL